MLRNRSIRAAAFEGMSQKHCVTNALINYHTKVAEGGVALTTVAYASVSPDGLSFPHQLLMSEGNITGLKTLVKAVHDKGALISIQIGHCGNMATLAAGGFRPIAPMGGINWYGPTFPRQMNQLDIKTVINDFTKAVKMANTCGFDAIEIHAGHGYLISQFLSPFTNRRKDEYGGTFENRSRFMREVLTAVKKALPASMAMIVKMNCNDGFEGGITEDEAILTAKAIEQCGADAIVVSGGFVSRAPMYVMRGSMPIAILAYFIEQSWKRFFVKLIGNRLIPPVPFKEGFFMEEAKRIGNAIGIPVILVGGMNSIATIETAMQQGFEFIAIARALIENANFINDLRNEVIQKSSCNICNYCVAKMYSGEMACHLNETNLPEALKQKITALSHG